MYVHNIKALATNQPTNDLTIFPENPLFIPFHAISTYTNQRQSPRLTQLNPKYNNTSYNTLHRCMFLLDPADY